MHCIQLILLLLSKQFPKSPRQLTSWASTSQWSTNLQPPPPGTTHYHSLPPTTTHYHPLPPICCAAQKPVLNCLPHVGWHVYEFAFNLRCTPRGILPLALSGEQMNMTQPKYNRKPPTQLLNHPFWHWNAPWPLAVAIFESIPLAWTWKCIFSRFICSGEWILFSNIIYLYALCYIFAGCHGICPWIGYIFMARIIALDLLLWSVFVHFPFAPSV